MYVPPAHLSDSVREQHADTLSHHPLPVNRELLKSVVEEKVGQVWQRKIQVLHVEFISSGTFHKAYLVTLVDTAQIVARIARPFMPTLKTESEVATIAYIRAHISIPVPEIYYYDSSTTNVLGAEYILMEKANGIPLSSLPTPYPRKLLRNVAKLILNLSSPEHEFEAIGSIYSSPSSSSFRVGPIISWPFFGSSRGLMPSGTGPGSLDRGPFKSTRQYLEACALREIQGVIWENEGRSKGRRPRTGPFDLVASTPNSGSDDEGEAPTFQTEEDEEEEADSMSEGSDEDLFYRDNRAHQRSTYLVSQTSAREDAVRSEMGKWLQYCEEELGGLDAEAGKFYIDLHDLSRENVFVDEHDHSKITCVIDWESTTTRPAWATHHFPALLHSNAHPHHGLHASKRSSTQQTPYPQTPLHPHPPKRLHSRTHTTLRMTNEQKFKEEMAQLPGGAEWLALEQRGKDMRNAHLVAEWDGWEEGLVESVLGVDVGVDSGYFGRVGAVKNVGAVEEEEKKRHLERDGDECGGIGGELGRRLGALVLVNGNGNGNAQNTGEDEDEAEEGEEDDAGLALGQRYLNSGYGDASGSSSPEQFDTLSSLPRSAINASATRKDRLAMFLALNGVGAG